MEQRGDFKHQTLHPTPHTPHPTPHTLHPTLHTLHPTPHTPHPAPYTPHPAPHTLHPTPHTLHPAICTLHPTPHTLQSAPYTLNSNDEVRFSSTWSSFHNSRPLHACLSTRRCEHKVLNPTIPTGARGQGQVREGRERGALLHHGQPEGQVCNQRRPAPRGIYGGNRGTPLGGGVHCLYNFYMDIFPRKMRPSRAFQKSSKRFMMEGCFLE